MTAIFNPTGPAPAPVPVPTRPLPTPTSTPTPAVAGPVGPVLELPGTPAAALVPVTHAGRPVGAFVVAGGRVRYRRLADPDRLVAAAAGAFAVAALVATVGVVATARRRPPAIRTVTMGPGGWARPELPRRRPADVRPDQGTGG
ncbi:hypothetical protein, partial [Micromonospora chersina]